jgi:hypothetical protein
VGDCWNYWALAHREILINLKGPFMHGGWQHFSPTLLVEVERSLLIRWVALYALASVWKRIKRETHARTLARLTGPSGVWCGVAVGGPYAKQNNPQAYGCQL